MNLENYIKLIDNKWFINLELSVRAGALVNSIMNTLHKNVQKLK